MNYLFQVFRREHRQFPQSRGLRAPRHIKPPGRMWTGQQVHEVICLLCPCSLCAASASSLMTTPTYLLTDTFLCRNHALNSEFHRVHPNVLSHVEHFILKICDMLDQACANLLTREPQWVLKFERLAESGAD